MMRTLAERPSSPMLKCCVYSSCDARHSSFAASYLPTTNSLCTLVPSLLVSEWYWRTRLNGHTSYVQ